MLGVVLEQAARQLDHPEHARVGDPVVDGPVLAPALYESAPAQAGEVVGDLGLRFACEAANTSNGAKGSPSRCSRHGLDPALLAQRPECRGRVVLQDSTTRSTGLTLARLVRRP